MAPPSANSKCSPYDDDDDYASPTRRVCVMDASGPLGIALVNRLLRRGYSVHAAVQIHTHDGSRHDELNYYEFEKQWFEKQRLKLFKTDPLDYHSILDALNGCSGLFYSFEPPASSSEHPPPCYDENMVEMEVRAAHNVVEACSHTETMEKLVFTSSATAVVWRELNSNTSSSSCSSLDEKNWSDINLCKKYKLWHALSKTLAEKTAWALAKDRGAVNMVSINGGFIIIPPPLLSSHQHHQHPYLKGSAEMYHNGVFVTVELPFLVDAHIFVFEDVSSYGRYLCFDHVIKSHEDVTNLAAMLLLPNSSAPPAEEEDATHHVCTPRISNKKLANLMLQSSTLPFSSTSYVSI